MERLTMRDAGGRAFWVSPNHPGGGYRLAGDSKDVMRLDRLAAYEDTGLQPEEITLEQPACVFYCNRRCNVNDDWCVEGPGCPWELSPTDAMRLLKNHRTAQIEAEGGGGPLTGEKTYIDRDTALNAFRLWFERIGAKPSLADVETLFGQIPAANAAPVRRGRWDGEGDGYAVTKAGEVLFAIDVWYCSECGHCIDEGIDDETILPNYCPNCGAKMDKEEAYD